MNPTPEEIRSRYKPFLSWSQAVELVGLFGLSERTLAKWKAAKLLTPFQNGGRAKWRREELINIVNDEQKPTP